MLDRLKNTGTIIALTSVIILIGTTWGFLDGVISDKIILTVEALCSAGVILGILNNPETPGLDLP